MKEIRETKLVEQTTVKYVANDGKEFDKYIDCDLYERRKYDDLLYAKLRAFMDKVELPFFDYLYYNVYRATLRNEEDRLNLYAYYEPQYYDSYEQMSKECPIGEIVTIVTNDDWVGFYKGDVLEEIKNFGKPSKKSDKSEK